jgi:hypothetical protein
MSMDDILKVLVESRQQGGSQSSSKGTDPMTELIGGLLGGGTTGGQGDAMSGILGSLLGGGQSTTSGGSQQQDTMSNVLGSLMGGGGQSQTSNQQQDAMSGMLGSLLGGGGQPQTSGQQQDAMSGVLGSLLGGGGTQQAGGLGTIMSLLEMVTGTGQQTGIAQSPLTNSNNPIMSLVQPFITPLANKLKISPQLAMIVVSFVLQKMLAHHPTSGRDSTQLNLDQMLNQLNSSGKLNPNLMQNSGMVEELSQVTGMNQAMAAKSLNTAFTMVGNHALKVAASPTTARKASDGVKRA